MQSPKGSPNRIGNWAVYGVARGFQQGRNGKSYAIETIKRPGLRRSVPLREIYYQLLALGEFATSHVEWEFLVVKLGVGYSGWTLEEMRTVFRTWIARDLVPCNIILPREFEIQNK